MLRHVGNDKVIVLTERVYIYLIRICTYIMVVVLSYECRHTATIRGVRLSRLSRHACMEGIKKRMEAARLPRPRVPNKNRVYPIKGSSRIY